MADIVDLAQRREAEMLEEAHRRRAIAVARQMMHGQRIEGGRVICADCGEPIPAGRLRAQPHAVRCLGCQAALEGGA